MAERAPRRPALRHLGSCGAATTEQVHQRLLKVPASARTAAVETAGEICGGAWAAERTGDALDG
ncbi:hypothetical protein [Streptomyces sp. AC154]|uniref:hypothetical protein n=1 Tax=Streptomyces sp. AC154 TaxID=3143184 RepID=UPI003F81B938